MDHRCDRYPHFHGQEELSIFGYELGFVVIAFSLFLPCRVCFLVSFVGRVCISGFLDISKKRNLAWYLRASQTFQTFQAESPSSGRVFGNQVQLVALFLTGLSWSPRFSPGSAGRRVSHGAELVVALPTGRTWSPRRFPRG